MGKEKIILSFIAVVVGLLFASVIFYLYQGTKVLSPGKLKTVAVVSSPTPKPKVILNLDEPKDEEINDSRVVKVSGQTDPDALIVILTQTDQQVLNPSSSGSFSTTVTIENGENLIKITAIGPNGDTNTQTRTVSFTIESF